MGGAVGGKWAAPRVRGRRVRPLFRHSAHLPVPGAGAARSTPSTETILVEYSL